ncbi:MAG: DUF4279 domain-containing protein [Pyrinomonadaceae bacterium]
MEQKLLWSTATLRVHSKQLDAEEITERLGVAPTKTQRLGELMSPRYPESSVFDENLWLLDFEQPSSLEAQLGQVSNFVSEHLAVFRELARVSEIDVFCGCSFASEPGTVALSPDMINSFAQVPIEIVFDFYFSGEGDSLDP